MAVVYYVDFVNGADTAPATNAAWGQKTAALTIDSTADTTHFVDAALTGIDDYINGAFFWNRTRGIGAYVTDFVALTDTVTLGGAIAGMAAGDDYYFIYAWKTVGQATITLAVGDIGYIRAGTTDTLATAINCTNDGTAAAYISVIGMGTGSATLETTDGSATEAWHDASTVRPIIDGNNAANNLNISSDNFWQLRNLDIRNTNTVGCLTVKYCVGTFIYNCVIRDQASTTYCLQGDGCEGLVVDTCDIKNSNGVNIYIINTTKATIKNTTIDGGDLVPTYGLSLNQNGTVFLDNCVFGSVATNTVDIRLWTCCKIYSRNCKFNSGTKISYGTGYYDSDIKVFEEDAQQVHGAHIATGYMGVAERVTDVLRDGGATSSVKIIPSANVGLLRPFCLCDFPRPTWRVWCPAGAATLTIYVRGLNWASYPTAAQLYLEAEYVTDDTTEGITRATVQSDEVLTDNTTWVGLQCAVNPHVASFVDLKLYLGLYEDATTGIYCDIKPVIS